MKLHHPDLDRTIEVPDGANLGVYKRSGWTEAPDEPAEQPEVPEGSQLLPDTPPSQKEGAIVPGDGKLPVRKSRS